MKSSLSNSLNTLGATTMLLSGVFGSQSAELVSSENHPSLSVKDPVEARVVVTNMLKGVTSTNRFLGVFRNNAQNALESLGAIVNLRKANIELDYKSFTNAVDNKERLAIIKNTRAGFIEMTQQLTAIGNSAGVAAHFPEMKPSVDNFPNMKAYLRGLSQFNRLGESGDRSSKIPDLKILLDAAGAELSNLSERLFAGSPETPEAKEARLRKMAPY